MGKLILISIIVAACLMLPTGNARTIEQAQQRTEKYFKLQEAKLHAELKQNLDKVSASLRSSEKPSYKLTNSDDVQALEAFYKSTGGDKWSNSTGWLKGDPCNPFWYGVYCLDGRVLQLNLVDNQLSGSIPADIAKASAMQVMRFYSNFLTGKIPSEIFTMKSLQIFDANNNQLSGGLPDITMDNLTDLILYNNMLSGNFPNIKAPMLIHLELSTNMFVGEFPESLSLSKNIQQLVVSRNMLTGSFPSSYGSFSSLQLLWTFYNNFDRPTFPDSWQGMTSMQQIQSDRMHGTMPDWFGGWKDLQIFVVINGALTGNFPSSICDCTKLQNFRIFNNSLTGTVPRCICTFRSLTDIEISDNQFTGPMPDCIGDVTSLASIFFSRNNFSGELPASIGQLVNLETLDVSENMMYGRIPSTINNLRDEIAEFAICYNKFSEIDEGLGDFFNRIKDYGCAFYNNPWSCPLSTEVPKECSAECSKCNTGAQHGDCGSCIQSQGCGWCNDGPNCLEGQDSGPENSYRCEAEKWTFGTSSSCP